MTTALDIITRGLRVAGILFKQETPAPDEASDGLASLNAMLASFSNEAMLITARIRESFNLTGAASYTIGTGGDFNTERPVYIVEAHVSQGQVTYNMGSITDENYERIQFKNLIGIPEFFNYTNSFPLGKLFLWPIPDASYVLHLLSEKQLTSIPNLSTAIILPPGWEELLVYNFAIRICPEYGQSVSPELKYLAEQSMRNVKLAIMKSRSMDAYPQSVGVYNIYNGWSR